MSEQWKNDEITRARLVRRIMALPREDLAATAAFIDKLQAAEAREATQGWISTEVAAQKLGRSFGHLNRLCLRHLQYEGKAELVKPPKGKPIWYINPAYDPRLQSA